MNIVDPILYQCRVNPLVTAICTPGANVASINYATLARSIHSAARSALKAGLAPGQTAALLIVDTVLHAAVAFALMRLGIATVSLTRPQIPKGIAVDAILTDRPTLNWQPSDRTIAISYDWINGDGAVPDYDRLCPDDENKVCRIILTSGSTGESKGVAFTHQDLAARVAHATYAKGSRFAHCARLFCDLGFGTSPGFRYALSLLSRGGTIYFLGPDPTHILQALDLHEIGGMATSPYGLGEFLKFFEDDSAFETRFDHIICQGAMLSGELSRRARARMCQNLYTSYGATETTTVAFGPASVTELFPGAVGYVTAGVKLEIVDAQGNLLPPDTDGRVRIRSKHTAGAYVGDPETSRIHFRDGCFYPGDIGRLREDGIFIISGREKTALNVGGDTVSPERVEEALTAFAGVNDAAVFATDNVLGIGELTALIVGPLTGREQALLQHCAARLPPSCVPVRLIVVPAIPRGSQGKIERHRLADLAKAAMASS
jgi:acyl-CoA synthetase (AMP-forming)/AMP-acid ligase II